MKKITFIAAILLIIGFASCKKVTIIEETITEVGEGPAEVDIYGVWEFQDPDTSNKRREYWRFEKGSPYYQYFDIRESGLIRVDYGVWFISETHLRRQGEGNLPYKLSGDSLVLDPEGAWNEKELFVRKKGVNLNSRIKTISASRTVAVPSWHNITTQNSIGMEGDFLYVTHRSAGTYKFMKWNTVNGMFVDSSNVPSGNWHALYFRSNNNKLYNTRNSGTYNMQQRTGINGGNSNLSSNGLSSIRAISANPSSGTVYASRNGIIYSGTEGGNFSTLTTFSGDYPRGVIYYKNDQFIGVWNGTLVLFEIAPELKIISQYTIPGVYLYESLSTNGTDVWAMSYNSSIGRYQYNRFSLP